MRHFLSLRGVHGTQALIHDVKRAEVEIIMTGIGKTLEIHIAYIWIFKLVGSCRLVDLTRCLCRPNLGSECREAVVRVEQHCHEFTVVRMRSSGPGSEGLRLLLNSATGWRIGVRVKNSTIEEFCRWFQWIVKK